MTQLLPCQGFPGRERICLDTLASDTAFSDKKDDLRVKNTVIYLRVERKNGKNAFEKINSSPGDVYSVPSQGEEGNLVVHNFIDLTRQTSFAKDSSSVPEAFGVTGSTLSSVTPLSPDLPPSALVTCCPTESLFLYIFHPATTCPSLLAWDLGYCLCRITYLKSL